MVEKTYKTPSGNIHYWCDKQVGRKLSLIFLPGLTADHRLFDKQIEYFKDRYNVLVWDAPAHGLSRPFDLSFSLVDKAKWLHDILESEGIAHPVLVGQSMGGYISQCFMEAFPEVAVGFVSIDSAPLKREYVTAMEIYLLKHTGFIYRAYPWTALKKAGAVGCSETEYGRTLMETFIDSYSKDEYCDLAEHGYKILAEAMESDRPYKLECPSILICGERDQAGSTKRYNRSWALREKLEIHWIEGAGHNSNVDEPEVVNQVLAEFFSTLEIYYLAL